MKLHDVDIDEQEVYARASELESDPHLLQQIDRIYDPYRLINGTAKALSREDLAREAAMGVALLEAQLAKGVREPNPIFGAVVVAWGHLAGYELMLRAATVLALEIKGGHVVVRKGR